MERAKILRIAVSALAWALLLALCLHYGRPWKAPYTGVLGSFVVTVLLVVFARAAPVRNFLRSLPRAQRVLVAVAVGALILGHTLGTYRATFPLVRWDMFTWVYEPEQVVFHEMVGVRSDGSEVPLHFARIAPSLHETFYWSLESWAEHARDDQRSGLIYSAILGAFGERYNAQHPDQTVQVVVGVRGTITGESDGEIDVRRERRWRVSLDRGTSP